jgi:hypothetical protein
VAVSGSRACAWERSAILALRRARTCDKRVGMKLTGTCAKPVRVVLCLRGAFITLIPASVNVRYTCTSHTHASVSLTAARTRQAHGRTRVMNAVMRHARAPVGVTDVLMWQAHAPTSMMHACARHVHAILSLTDACTRHACARPRQDQARACRDHAHFRYAGTRFSLTIAPTRQAGAFIRHDHARAAGPPAMTNARAMSTPSRAAALDPTRQTSVAGCAARRRDRDARPSPLGIRTDRE